MNNLINKNKFYRNKKSKLLYYGLTILAISLLANTYTFININSHAAAITVPGINTNNPASTSSSTSTIKPLTSNTLQVSVSVDSGGKPVTGVSVSLNNQKQVTNSSGVASFNEVAGSYSYIVSGKGFTTLTNKIDILPSITGQQFKATIVKNGSSSVAIIAVISTILLIGAGLGAYLFLKPRLSEKNSHLPIEEPAQLLPSGHSIEKPIIVKPEIYRDHFEHQEDNPIINKFYVDYDLFGSLAEKQVMVRPANDATSNKTASLGTAAATDPTPPPSVPVNPAPNLATDPTPPPSVPVNPLLNTYTLPVSTPDSITTIIEHPIVVSPKTAEPEPAPPTPKATIIEHPIVVSPKTAEPEPAPPTPVTERIILIPR